MMKKKKSFALMALTLVATLSLTACSSSSTPSGETKDETPVVQTNNLIFTSGGTSGTYYPYAGAVSTVWNDQVAGLNVTVNSSGGSAANLKLIAENEADIAIVQNDVMTYAYEGTENFEGKAITNFATMATVYAEVCQIVVDPSAGITSLADLAGKRVSVGDVGSGVESNAKQILAAAGLTFDDINADHLGFGDSASKMKDKQLDAFFVTAGIPTTAIMELASTNTIDILAFDEASADSLKAEYPFYTSFSIPQDTYAGMTGDVLTIAVKATLVVNPDLDEELVYEMTKALFENKDAIATAHAKGAELDINTATEGVSVPFHPGAERYFKEVGVLN